MYRASERIAGLYCTQERGGVLRRSDVENGKIEETRTSCTVHASSDHLSDGMPVMPPKVAADMDRC